MEYVTGAVMERLFNVKYWDYSNQKFNLNGYICLTSSLGWGLFSVLLVKFVHVPIEGAVLKIPTIIAEILLRKSKQGVPKESGLYIITCTELEMSAAAKNSLSEAASIGIIKMPVHYKSHTIPG